MPSDIMKHFTYAHLRKDLQDISSRFFHLAHELDALLPAGAEKSTALRKLLEGKDAAVRAARELEP